jgi:hypothetical protein
MQIWRQLFFFSLKYFRRRFFKKRYEGEVSENLARSRHSEAILDFRFWILDLFIQIIQNPKSKIQNPKVWKPARSFLA